MSSSALFVQDETTATVMQNNVAMMQPPQTTIVPIETSSIRRLTAGQAVTDLASAVKELVDNALDAGATCINIRLWDSGTKILEVSDDGCGVPLESRPYIAMKHATSKIRSFEDIYSGASTLGFRGEALFCLANISQQLLVCTRTAADELGQRLVFGRDGYLNPESVCQAPRKIGTTVAVVGLFDALPVRKADMMKRIKKQRGKLLRLMQGYAVLCTGVRFNLMDIIGPESRENTILATSAGNTGLEQTVSSALGSRFLSSLTQISVDLTTAIGGDSTTESQWKVEGLVSKAPNQTGRNGAQSRELQFFSINHRPVELPRISRALSDAWRAIEGANSKRPACVLCFTLPNNAYDVNLSPDKREVFLRDEAAICELIREAVASLWSSQSEGGFPANEVELLSQTHAKAHVPVAATAAVQAQNPASPGRRRRARRRMAFVHDLSTACMQHEGGERMEAMQGTVRRISEDEVGENSKMKSAPLEGESMEQKKAAAARDPLEEPAPRLARPSDRDRIKWSQTQLQFNKVSADELPNQTGEIEMLDKQSAAPEGLGQDKTLRTVSREHSEHSRVGLEQFAFEADGEWSRILKRKAESGPHDDGPRKESRTALKSTPNPTNSASERNASGPLVTPDEMNDKNDPRAGRAVPSRQDAPIVAKRATNQTRQTSEAMDNDDEMDCSGNGSSSEDSPVRPRKLQRRGSGVDSVEEERAEAPKNSVVWDSFMGTEQIMEAAKAVRLAMLARQRNLEKHANARSTMGTDNNGSDKTVDVENVEDRSNDNRVIVGFRKSDFSDMEIIGQFNLGFILARCRNNHLWILDQHACDEKYNFERLCANTIIHEQKLIAPMPLELSASEESCILDHMEIFEQNGFRFSYDSEKPPRHRLALTALPHSGAPDGRKAVQFGKEDVRELCTMLDEDDGDGGARSGGDGHGTGADGSGVYGNNAVRRYAGGLSQLDKSSKTDTNEEEKGAGKIIKRLPKAIAMFASRACRGSIMIGTALSEREMDAIVKKLAGVDSPWNCPHGRPTMRHVRDLAPTLLEDDKNAERHLAGPTMAAISQIQEVEPNQEEGGA